MEGSRGYRLRRGGAAGSRAGVSVEVVEGHRYSIPAVAKEGRHFVLSATGYDRQEGGQMKTDHVQSKYTGHDMFRHQTRSKGKDVVR